MLVQDLLREAKRLSAGTKINPLEKKEQTALKAKRRYPNDIQAIYQHVADVIVKAKLHNFGALLKGQDYQNLH